MDACNAAKIGAACLEAAEKSHLNQREAGSTRSAERSTPSSTQNARQLHRLLMQRGVDSVTNDVRVSNLTLGKHQFDSHVKLIRSSIIINAHALWRVLSSMECAAATTPALVAVLLRAQARC